MNQRMDIQIGSNGYLFNPPIGHWKGFFLLLMKGSCSISMTIFRRFLIKSFNYSFISLSALGSLQFPLIYRKMDGFDSRTDFLFRVVTTDLWHISYLSYYSWFYQHCILHLRTWGLHAADYRFFSDTYMTLISHICQLRGSQNTTSKEGNGNFRARFS